MTRELLAADIVDRLPALVADSKLNAALTVGNLLGQFEREILTRNAADDRRQREARNAIGAVEISRRSSAASTSSPSPSGGTSLGSTTQTENTPATGGDSLNSELVPPGRDRNAEQESLRREYAELDAFHEYVKTWPDGPERNLELVKVTELKARVARQMLRLNQNRRMTA